jgi:phage terminase small subunit
MLTERRKRFVDAYLADPNGVQAARIAGYADSQRSLAVEASRLLTDADVLEHLGTAAYDAARAAELTPEYVIARFQDIADAGMDDGQLPAATAALRELARILGLGAQRIDINLISERAGTLAAEHGLTDAELDEVKEVAQQLLQPPNAD